MYYPYGKAFHGMCIGRDPIFHEHVRMAFQISGGTWAVIGISSTVGFDLLHAATAAFLISSRITPGASTRSRPSLGLYEAAECRSSNCQMSSPLPGNWTSDVFKHLPWPPG